MDVSWVNVQYDIDNKEMFDKISDNSIDRISIGSETIKIFYNEMSKMEKTYIKVIIIENIFGYEYPTIRGEGI